MAPPRRGPGAAKPAQHACGARPRGQRRACGGGRVRTMAPSDRAPPRRRRPRARPSAARPAPTPPAPPRRAVVTPPRGPGIACVRRWTRRRGAPRGKICLDAPRAMRFRAATAASVRTTTTSCYNYARAPQVPACAACWRRASMLQTRPTTPCGIADRVRTGSSAAPRSSARTRRSAAQAEPEKKALQRPADAAPTAPLARVQGPLRGA